MKIFFLIIRSGASIVIEKTEALVSIDVNTGQNTGNQSSQNLIFNTNLEACKEIARQIKLRNLAGNFFYFLLKYFLFC